jgi:hypothetical protein
MATRDSSGVERRRTHLDGNRPRTHPKHSGRKATKVRPPFAERRTLTGWRTTDARLDGQERIGGEL